MKIGMYIILCMHAVWLETHPCLKGNFPEAWALVFALLVLPVLPSSLNQGMQVPYDTCTHMYLPCV